MPERVITQIDLLIHPDYHLIGEDEIEPSHADLREKWDARIAQLGENEQTLVFYFPGIPLSGKIPGEPRTKISPELISDEAQRRIIYERILGDRFFIFADWEKPRKETLIPQLKDRGFAYDSQTTQLVAYGEYLYLCVDAWQMATASSLNIPSTNQITLSDLSVVHPMHPSSFLYDI